MSQLVNYGTVVSLKKNPDFCVLTDGYYTVDVYIPGNTAVQIGKAYQIYKQGDTYFLGQEIVSR
jgi:hypothetical protein